MGVIGVKFPTLLDVVSRTSPDGSVGKDIVEMLQEKNVMLEEMVWEEGNDGTGHKTTIRTGYPTATWRLLNYGVQPSKSTTTQIRDTTGMLEAYAEVDKSLVNMSGDPKGFRASEDSAFLDSMSNDMMETVIYGNASVNQERFTGLAPRFMSKSAANGVNIIDAGGLGSDNTSIWLVVWGKKTAHGIYPKGSQGGIHSQDLGEVTLEDANRGKYQGFRTHYKWDAGVTIRDWRYVSRGANIDVSDLKGDLSSGPNLIDIMTDMIEALPADYMSVGRPVFYVPRAISSVLRKQAKNTKNVNLTLEEIAGKKVTTFDGIPVRRVDAILTTEARVV